MHDIYIGEPAGCGKARCAVPLGEGCSAVRTSPLPQGETADEPKGEQDDGQEDAQEGEGVLQDPDSAEREGGTRVRTPDPAPPARRTQEQTDDDPWRLQVTCQLPVSKGGPSPCRAWLHEPQRGRQTTISHHSENVKTEGKFLKRCHHYLGRQEHSVAT